MGDPLNVTFCSKSWMVTIHLFRMTWLTYSRILSWGWPQMLCPLELAPGPIYAKEALLPMLLRRCHQYLTLFWTSTTTHGILLQLEFVAIRLLGLCSMRNGPKGRMVSLLLIFGAQRLAAWVLAVQQFGSSKQRRGCIFVLFSIGASPYYFSFLSHLYSMESKGYQCWSSKFWRM